MRDRTRNVNESTKACSATSRHAVPGTPHARSSPYCCGSSALDQNPRERCGRLRHARHIDAPPSLRHTACGSSLM